jgi:hypothetical protein
MANGIFRAAIMSALALHSGWALAGSGPWVLAQGNHQAFLGVDAQHFTTFAPSTGGYGPDTVIVGDGISSLGLVGVATIGLGGRFEAEFEVPWRSNFAQNEENDVCAALGDETCAATNGVAVLRVGTKAQLLDEVYGSPLSLSLGLDLRFGQLTQATRSRITNLGEGTFDVEPTLSIGRVGSLGKKGGYWSINADLGVRYRIPLQQSYLDYAQPIPGVEISLLQQTFFTPIPAISLGPTFSLLSRPNGVDFEDLLASEGAGLADPDRFAALRVMSMRVGAKFFIRGGDRVTVVLGAERTVYAFNNPSDVIAVYTGIALRNIFKRREG